MNIGIKGLNDERFNRQLLLIGNLFFEETELFFDNSKAVDIIVAFDLQIKDKINIHSALQDKQGHIYTATYQKNYPVNSSEKERFKAVKNGVSHVYLTVLQEYTGILQKWGILTGIRPVKLLHKLIQESCSKEEAHRRLQNDYLISDEKINLMQEIIERQMAAIPDLYQLKNEVSIYIGIPYCPTKCAYCTFPAYAIKAHQHSVKPFLKGLHYEIRKTGEWLRSRKIKITTVYFGGGTPTSIAAEDMDLLYEEMYRSFPDVENIREITVEAGRPDTITPEKLEVLKKWNIDRISINPQSYVQETLKAIGRHHTVQETIDKFYLARKMGMNNINMDLIIGLPGEGIKEFSYSLRETEKLMPESLTVHTLSFKRASEMTQNKEKYEVASREEAEGMMGLAQQWTNAHDYQPYYLYRQKNILGNLENTGYCLPKKESIYNILIMEEQQTIIGLGCGAASKFIDKDTGKIIHFANPKDPKNYQENYQTYTDKKINLLNKVFPFSNN